MEIIGKFAIENKPNQLHKQVYPTEKHFDYDYIKNNNPQDIPVY